MEKPDILPAADLIPVLNAVPQDLHHVHLMGICGTGMSSLAGILKLKGCFVTGSDQNAYPPMSQYLEDLAIPLLEGYRAENLKEIPDLVIVGNVITRNNPEAIELGRLKIPYLSFPQALREFAMEGKKPIVICGTHGKTTTSALAAWVLENANLDPSFMIGGIPHDFRRNYRIGAGGHFVIEGDEYDTAFFDKGPKFLHYDPWIAILTSIEFDHADIYRDFDHVVGSFRRFIQLLPSEGLLIANGDDPTVVRESKGAKCPVVTYGFGEGVDWSAANISFHDGDTRFELLSRGEAFMNVSTPLFGRHNISNLLSVVALGEFLRIDPSLLADGLKGFSGVKRRQEIKGEERGVLIMEDFAHHPTSVKETIGAVKGKYGDRRLMAVFEPRSNSSRRNIFQQQYALSFDQADVVFIPEPPFMEKILPEERFSSLRLVEDLRKRGLKARYCPDTGLLLREIIGEARRGDVVLVMSNGAFDELPGRLLDRLKN